MITLFSARLRWTPVFPGRNPGWTTAVAHQLVPLTSDSKPTHRYFDALGSGVLFCLEIIKVNAPLFLCCRVTVEEPKQKKAKKKAKKKHSKNDCESSKVRKSSEASLRKKMSSKKSKGSAKLAEQPHFGKVGVSTG